MTQVRTFATNDRSVKDLKDKTSEEKKEADYTDVGSTTPQKNQIDKFGGKPKGDESIANRGVTKPNSDKDKAI